ncbi:cyclase [Candidatus Leptofilum sp.]|uniref:cyclase n=1 Tax=Candidatus Leptofilum sp. TaxID=3241576 RepID=UPI003B5A1FBC
MDLKKKIISLLDSIGSSQITPSPYDTAWVARLSTIGLPLGFEALEWLRQNQLADGCWGAEKPIYYHERAICTLAAVIALAKYGDESDRARWQKGLVSLEMTLNRLHTDLMGYTIGFELIFPTLLSEAEELGILQIQRNGFFKKLMKERDKKLSRLPTTINRSMTAAFSSEMVGDDNLHLLNEEKLQQLNGSISYSPSSTAFYLLHFQPENEKALDYLHNAAVGGAVPYVTPIEIFEYAWTLWNLSLVDPLDQVILQHCQPILDKLEKEWRSTMGIASCIGLTLPDGDDTSVTYKVLNHYKRDVDIEAVLRFERDDHFLCFEYEADPSLSTNIHVLAALRQAKLPIENQSVQNVLSFLQRSRFADGFWVDKWHASPFYPTCHAIIACSGYIDEFVKDSIEWALSSQNEDGSWGYYVPSAEETSYCIQALSISRRFGHKVPKQVIRRGVDWLNDHQEMRLPLWIGKSLYSPELVVESSVLSALLLGELL